LGAEATTDTNLQGQKLGRKGRITRERILAAARELIEEHASEDFSISAVARRAELRVSSIYNYFPDLTDLFLTVMEPVIRESQAGYFSILESYWPDDQLEQKCEEFVEAFHGFWERNVRYLHLRNILAQQHNSRVLLQRISTSRQTVSYLTKQMGAPGEDDGVGISQDMAAVLYAGMERVVTLVTDELLNAPYPRDVERRFGVKTLKQQTRLLVMAIRAERERRAAL
jgi:AcrR family transcriptional regulator